MRLTPCPPMTRASKCREKNAILCANVFGKEWINVEPELAYEKRIFEHISEIQPQSSSTLFVYIIKITKNDKKKLNDEFFQFFSVGLRLNYSKHSRAKKFGWTLHDTKILLRIKTKTKKKEFLSKHFLVFCACGNFNG